MGKTYHKNSKKFDEESSGRSGKPARHASGKKTGGMRTLNSYVDDDIDLDDDIFDDDIEMTDDIQIQHNTNTK
jgi:hypothetical protein